MSSMGTPVARATTWLGCPFGFANGATPRGSVDFANVDRPAAAVAGDVDIEAGHWSPPGLTEALPPGTSLPVDDEMPSLLTRTRSATCRFKWTVPARRDGPGSRPRQSSPHGDDHQETARRFRRRPDRGARNEVASYTEATYGGSVRSCRGCVWCSTACRAWRVGTRCRPRPADPPGRRSCAGGGSESTARP